MPETRQRRPSVRKRVRVATVLVSLLALVVGSLLALTAVQVSSAQDELENELGPARVELGDLLALYVDQETAQRGYVITGRDEFLRPYVDAGPAIQRNLARLRDQVSPSVWRQIEEMVAAHAAWLEATQPEVDAARAGRLDDAAALVAAGDGKARFDELRSHQAAAEDLVAEQQDAATKRADALLARLSVLLAVTMTAFLTATLLAAAGFSRNILRPLAALGRDSRAVAAGRLEQSVRPAGPQEVAEVAEDVDVMRRHLLDELDASRRATEALALGEPTAAALLAALSHQPLTRPGLDVAGQIDAAQGVLAGDFVDVVELDDDRVAVVLGDVSGHGPAAAVTGLRLKTAIASGLGRASVHEVLGVALRGLSDRDAETFATAFLGAVDLAAGTLTYVNAGHPPPLLIRAGTPAGDAEELEPTGPLLSPVLADAAWPSVEVPFGPGDCLVVFSDGVIEARDDAVGEFGVDGLLASLDLARDQTAGAVVDRVRAAVRDHAEHQRDDVTVLVVRRD